MSRVLKMDEPGSISLLRDYLSSYREFFTALLKCYIERRDFEKYEPYKLPTYHNAKIRIPNLSLPLKLSLIEKRTFLR